MISEDPLDDSKFESIGNRVTDFEYTPSVDVILEIDEEPKKEDDEAYSKQQAEKIQNIFDLYTPKVRFTVEEIENYGKENRESILQVETTEKTLTYFMTRVIKEIRVKNKAKTMSPVKGGKWRHPPSEDVKRILEEAKRFKAHIKREVPEREKYAKQSKSILNKLAPGNFEKLKVQLYDISKLYEEY